jgi:hypothetical protein
MSEDLSKPGTSATLGGLEGHGYGVVESLASLGKGRRLTGLFRAPLAHGESLRAALAACKRLPFSGPVHFRHHSLAAAVEVELARIEEEGGELLVEFVAQDVPYGLG